MLVVRVDPKRAPTIKAPELYQNTSPRCELDLPVWTGRPAAAAKRPICAYGG
jgi:hypothetical protein